MIVADTSHAAKCNSDNGLGASVLHSCCPSLTVGLYKADYPASLDARCFRAILSDLRNRTMFDRRGSRRDTDIDAWEWR